MKRRQTLSRRVLIFLAVVFVAVCLLMVSFIIALKVPMFKVEYAYRDVAEQEDFDDESFERNGKWYGLCAKNSIRSVDDFRATVSKDRILKIHYADFRWENAKMKKLDEATLAYVYFRKDDKIFVKKKRVKLPAGDEYITDGNKRVRIHCCNNYTADPPSFVQVLLVPPLEGNVPKPLQDTPPSTNFVPPAYEDGATAVVSALYLPPPTPIIPGNGIGGGGGGSGPIIPGNGGGGGGGGETKPIPEAATILLVGIGLAVSLVGSFIENYNTRKGKTTCHRTWKKDNP